MRSETRELGTPGIDDYELSPSDVFGLLTDERRRYALHYLSTSVGAVSLDDLAEQIALWEGTPSKNRYERILTDLYHRHLPRLTDAGVARYDPERETVELLDAADRVSPFLKLVERDDVR